MSLPSETNAMSVVESAVGSVLGGFLLWVLTCSIAGFIATAASEENLSQFEWIWACAWILHLGVAGIALWGLLVICIHGFLISALVHGTERPMRVLTASFLLQLTTSTIVTAILEPYHGRRILAVWSCVALPTIFCLVLDICRARKRRLAWEASLAEQSRRSPNPKAQAEQDRFLMPCRSWSKALKNQSGNSHLRSSPLKGSSVQRRKW